MKKPNNLNIYKNLIPNTWNLSKKKNLYYLPFTFKTYDLSLRKENFQPKSSKIKDSNWLNFSWCHLEPPSTMQAHSSSALLPNNSKCDLKKKISISYRSESSHVWKTCTVKISIDAWNGLGWQNVSMIAQLKFIELNTMEWGPEQHFVYFAGQKININSVFFLETWRLITITRSSEMSNHAGMETLKTFQQRTVFCVCFFFFNL